MATSERTLNESTAGVRSASNAAGSAVDDNGPLPLRSLIRTARPKQWSKNVLVFAAPGAAGVLTEADVLLRLSVTFLVFCLVSSSTYFLNDLLDRESDRRHPVKRDRPIASGALSQPLAVAAAIALLLLGLGAALAVGGLELGAVVVGYVVLTGSYSVWLKHIAVVDLGAVAAGFVLRAIAGGVAAGVPLSDWFLIVASSGSMFMIAGKRAAEHNNLGRARADTRAILSTYSIPFLRYVRSTSSGVAITAYCLWAFEKSVGGSGLPWFELSIAPFVMGIFRYALLVDADDAEAPEDVVLGDRPLQLLGLLWVALFAAGVYAT